MNSKPLVIFAYAFIHRKTFDFIKTLIDGGFNNLYIIAAPKLELGKKETTNIGLFGNIRTAKDLSKFYGLKYIEVAHTSVDEIKRFVPLEAKTAIIAGARILKKEIIDIFEHGIINFHPGAIPETSGLDSFYWMIKKKAKPGITVHYIDHKVDSGELIFFHHIDINEINSVTGLISEIYNSQIQALKRLLIVLSLNKKCLTMKIDRPEKNHQIDDNMKTQILEGFDNWLGIQKKMEAKVSNCYEAVKDDNINLLKNNFDNEFIGYKNNFGRGIISECAFYNSIKCLKFLIKHKCDVNQFNEKGTTPLMYSKTLAMNSLDKKKLDIAKDIILELKKAGANANQRDIYGKTVFDYLNGKNRDPLFHELSR